MVFLKVKCTFSGDPRGQNKTRRSPNILDYNVIIMIPSRQVNKTDLRSISHSFNRKLPQVKCKNTIKSNNE